MRKALRFRGDERGSVMVLALLVTLVILGIGITVMWVSSSGMKISSNVTRRQEALYAAEVGIERGRALLASEPNWSNLLKGTACSPALAYSAFDDEKGYPLCVGSEKLQGLAFVAAPSQGHDDKVGSKMTYTVWVRNDWAVECDDQSTEAHEVVCNASGTKGNYDSINTDRNGRVILRAEGIGRDGLSYVALEAVISKGIGIASGQAYTQAGLNAQGSNAMKGSISE